MNAFYVSNVKNLPAIVCKATYFKMNSYVHFVTRYIGMKNVPCWLAIQFQLFLLNAAKQNKRKIFGDFLVF